MIRLRHKLFVYSLRALDPTILFGSLLVGVTLLDESPMPVATLLERSFQVRDALGFVTLAAGWLISFTLLVRYDTDRFTTLKSELLDAATATAAAAFLLVVVSGLFSFERITSEVVVFVWAASATLTMGSRVMVRRFLRLVRRSGYNYRHLIVVGTNARAAEIAARVERLPELGYKVTGFVSNGAATVSSGTASFPYPVLGDVADIQRVLEQGPVDELLVCLPTGQSEAILRVVGLAHQLGIVARLFPDAAGAQILSRLRVERFNGECIVTLFREQLVLQLLCKRLLDIVVSTTLLIVLSPLLAVVAALIRLTSPGPVLFVQKRVGMNKRTFDLYKFRSMYADAERRRHELDHLNEMDGPVFKIQNDPRVTPLGRVIRKTSIDELPQLWNVFRGQMSLVGPRPPLPQEVDHYEWLYRKRLSIKPGVTCLWQVTGRNRVSFAQWMELDRTYVDNWSLWLDLKILARTVPAVLSLKGAS